MYADDLVLFGKSEKGLIAMIGHFFEVFKRRGLGMNEDKAKATMSVEEQGSVYEVTADGHCLGFVLEESRRCG